MVDEVMDGDPPSPQDAKRRELYTALKADGAKLPDYNTFSRALSTDHKKVEELYTALKADGAKLPDYNTFSRAVGVDTSFLIEEAKQKKQAKQASPTQPLHPMTTPQDGADGGASSLAVASSAAGSSAPFTPPAQPGSTGGARVEPRAPGNLLFERRWLDKNAPSIVNDDGTTSTHKMAWGEVDGKYVAFPTIIESTKGLRELTPEAAMNLALKSGEYRQFDTKEEASSYADGGYKDLVPQEHKGRLEKQAPSIIGSYYTSLRDEHDAMDEWRGLRESERAGQKNLSPFMSAALDRADRAKRTIDTYKQQEEELREHDLDVSMRSFKDLTKEANVPGVLVADHDKVEQEVQRIMRKNGSDDDVYHDRLVNDLTARINSQQVVEEVEAQAKPKVQALLEEKGKDAYEGFVADKPIKAEAESKLKEREIYYTAQADSARNRLTQQAGAEASDLKQRYEAQAQEIQQAFDMGGMDPEQANAAIEGINEGYKQEVSDLNERAQRTYAQDAARLNRQYLNEQQDIIKTANARIDEALGAYRRNMGERDPELERQITAIYEQEYKKASDKRTGLIAANADLDAMTANSLPAAMVERLGKSFVKNLGGAIRTLGAGEGQGWVYRLGADMENAYLLPQSRAHKFSDLLDPVNFAQLTGELAGGMAPSIAAGGLVAIGTAGAGAPAIATLLTSGMASYATEGLQNSMDVRDQVMRQTGDSNKATDAAYKTFGAHLDTWYLGLLDGLPFAGKVLDAIPSKALRMGASATAEMTTQTLQEVTQDESMGNIIAGRDPWDTGIEGVSALDRILDPERLGEMAVTMAPLTLFGASGQLREGGVQAQASDYARQLVQKKLVAAAIGNARSQWINNLLDQKGEAFATAVVGALHQGGHIDLDAVKGIQGDIGSVVTARGEADRAGLRDDRKGDYVALRTAHMADVAKAAKEGDGPVKTAMLARAKEKEAVIAAMLAGQDADYVSVTFPDGGRYIMGVDEAKAFMAAPNNMTSLVLAQSATQNATFSGHGPKGMILAQKYGEALERFSNNIQQAREWHASRDRQLKDRQQEEIRRIEAKKEAFKREAQRREAEAEQRRSERTQEYRRKQEETARAKEIKDEIIEDYIGSMTMNTADAIDDADGTLVHESGPKPSIAERIRLARQAMRDLNAKINALRGKYKDEPAAKSVLDLIEEDLFRVQQHRKRLVEQARQQDIEVEGNPKQEAKAELMAQAASELQDAGLMEKVPTTPVSETNETDGTKTEGTNGGAVTSSPPGTTHTDNKGGQNTQQDAEQHNLPPEHGVQGAGTAGATAKDTGAPTGTPVQEQPVPPSQSLKKEPQTEEERTEHERTLDNALLGGDAQRNREAGKRTIAGREYVRQSEKDVPTGSSGSTQFSDKEHVPFDYVLMEADDIQPSHINGTRNPYHFIPEAQPKPRTDKESQVAIQGISAKPNPNLSGASPTAYSGAPIVNARGEVIQGNNRSAGYKGHYAQGGTSYKAALARDAEKFGFTPEQVEGMKKPVLVRRVNVTDARAIELGNYDAKDIESGSKQGIDPAAVSPRIPSGVKSRITGMLFGDDVDATLKEAIRKQYKDVADVLAPYLNPSQRSGLFRKDSHEPSATGVDQIEQLVRHFIFDGGPQDLAGVFEGGIPHHARSGIMAAVPSLFSSPESVGIIREVQQAIMAAAEFRMSGVGTFDSWVSQADAFGPSPAETYSPTELAMAKMFDEARTAKEVRAKLEAYANGTKATEADMFTEAAPGKTRQRSAEDVFGITSQQQDDQGRGDTGVSQEQAGTVPEAARQGVGAAEGGRQRGSVAGTAGKDAAVGKRTKQIEARKTDSGTILEQRTGNDPELIAQHNISAEKLLHASRMGGLAVPSLAITKVGDPIDGFGEITLLGDADMIDPKGPNKTKVFGADIYSPRYPQVSHIVPSKNVRALNDKLGPYIEKYGGNTYYADDLVNGPRALKENPAVMAAFLDANGIHVEPAMRDGEVDGYRTITKLREAIENGGQEKYDVFLDDLMASLDAKEKLFKGFTYAGNRRYEDHNLDNVIRTLKKELRAGEGFNYGPGTIRAKFTTQFRSVAAIRKAKGRLVSKEDFEKVKEEVADDLVTISEGLAPYYKYDANRFGFLDTVSNVIMDASKVGLVRALKDYNFKDVPDGAKEAVRDYMQKLANLPTEYFEAKIMRAVQLNEFHTAVIPSNASNRVRTALKEQGLNVVEYNKDKKGDRQRAIEEAAKANDLLFQKQTSSTAPPTGITHVDKVVRALRDVAPGVKVHTYTDNEAYNRQSQLRGGKSGQHSTAFYDASDDSIHINLNRAKDNTLFHEAAHPVLKAVIAENPELLHGLYDQLADHPDFGKYNKFAERYEEGQRKVEAVVEYMADIAAGKARSSALPNSMYQKFKAWVKDLLNKLGFRGVKLDPANLKQFAEDFATAVTEGRKIKLRKLAEEQGTVSLQDDADRLVDGWYSRLDDAVVDKGQTMPASQWQDWVKARAKEGKFSLEEAKWTGLNDFLAEKGKAKVTPKEVREFLKENRVRVEVVELSDTTAKETLSPDVVIEEDEDGSWMLYSDTGTEGPFNSEEEARAFGIQYGYTEADSSRSDDSPITRHSKWQLPGGSNYREIAITIPGPEKYRVPAEHSMGEKADVNRVLHMRFNDRIGPNGEKILFIEELQSDFGQSLRKLEATIDQNFDDIVEKMKADGVLKKRCP